MTSYNKPCPICRKKRIKNGICLFCKHIINKKEYDYIQKIISKGEK